MPAAPSTREKDCMLVLHGFWSNSGGMRLWAEDSDLLVKSPSQALRSARPHPFAAPADLIAGIHPGKPATAVLLLPSLRSAPLDSPELIRLAPRPAARTDPMLLAWTVPVVDLDPTAALAAFDQPAPTSATARPSTTWPSWPFSRASWSSVVACCPSCAATPTARPPAGVRCCRDATWSR
ncbi:helicase HelZ [Mycobacterium tuberculosis]|nr:helicase HelZ [Mycobacterium tuberculosis]AMC77878.1 helicase HelZ [Mycobacterium tuberculosis]